MTPHSNPSDSLAHAQAAASARRRRNRWTVAVFIAVLALAGGALWYSGSSPTDAAKTGGSGAAPRQGSDAAPAPRAIPVVAAPVRQGNLDIHLFALGTVTPLNAVEVHSRVDGQILSIAFEEGQMVKAGDLLAQIDPRPFEMQLTLAAGQLARDQALLENAQADLKRYRTLLDQDSIASQQVDTQESLVRQYQAALQAGRARIDDAKMQLAHARVIAPISGRVGLRQVGPGNIVRASDVSGIVMITQLQPVGVVFPIPEDALPRVMKRLHAGVRIPVDIYDRAQKEKLGGGRLLAADNQIDPATGTIKLKAEFRNADGALFANQFVNVKMLVETRPKATLVPTAAIQRGAAGTFVYVVKDDHTVAVAPVKTGLSQGEVTSVEGGIAAGAMVVIDGADRLREGTKVELIVREPPATPVSDAKQRSTRPGNEGIKRPPRAAQGARAGANA